MQVLGPKHDALFLKTPTEEWSVQEHLGREAGERVKLISTGRAGLITLTGQVHLRPSLRRLLFTMRAHPFPANDPGNAEWPGTPSSAEGVYRSMWGAMFHQAHGLEVDGCECHWIRREHGLYLVAYGPLSIRASVFSHVAAQGVQVRSYVAERKPGMPEPDASDLQEVADCAFEWCGLTSLQGAGRASFAANLQPGIERAAIRRCVFIHDHKGGGVDWSLGWKSSEAEPGAAQIYGRAWAEIAGCTFDYRGMDRRPIVRLHDNGLSRLVGNVFRRGGYVSISGDGDAIVARNVWDPADASENPPELRVHDSSGALVHKGSVLDNWTT